MNQIKMQEAALIGTAQHVRKLCGTASDINNSINSSWNRLDAGWETYARENITAMYRRAQRELRRTNDMLMQISTALVQTSNTISGADRQAMRQFSKLSGTYAGRRGSGFGPIVAACYGRLGLKWPVSTVGQIAERVASADNKALGAAISAGLMIGTKFLPPPFGKISMLIPKPVFDAVGGFIAKVAQPVANFVPKVVANPVVNAVGGAVKAVGKFFSKIF